MLTLLTEVYGFDSDSKWKQITFTNEVFLNFVESGQENTRRLLMKKK